MAILQRPGWRAQITIVLVGFISLVFSGCIGVTDILTEIEAIVDDANTPKVIVVSFQVDLPAQPPITFTGEEVTLQFGTDMTVTASAPGADSFAWYLDGAPVAGGTGPSVTLGSALETGPYELSVVVHVGSEYFSDRIVFTVVSS